MTHILAIDQGTTSSRAMVFRGDGAFAATAQREFPQHFPQSGWVEHDPEDLWNTVLATAREAIAGAGLTARDIAAIGITNQRETTLVWDRATGKPIHNAIVWQDRRTAPLCGALRAQGCEDELAARTGLLLDPYFSASKIAWLLDHVPGAHERAERGELAFGTVDTFLLWRLTGGRLHATDASNASRTMLFDIHTLDWNETLLQRLRIPRAVLPEVRPSSALNAQTDASMLGRAMPLGGVAGDQQAATFGQACWEPGLAKNTYGTGCFLLLNTGVPVKSTHDLLTTIAWQRDGATTYALEGSVFIG